MYITAVRMFNVPMGWTPPYVNDILNRTSAQYGSNHYGLPRTRIDSTRRLLHSLGYQSETLFLRK